MKTTTSAKRPAASVTKANAKHSKAAASSKKTPAPGGGKPKIFSMAFSKVYPMYVTKAAKKNRSKGEVDTVIKWLTGNSQKQLEALVKMNADFEKVFRSANMNPKRTQISGKVCGVEVSTVPDGLMRDIRYLDKLVDELAQGKPLDKVLRK